MKKIAYYLIIAIALSTTSCNDVLDVEPTDRYSELTVWENEDAVELYTTGFYAALRDASEIGGSNLSDGYSDILKYTNGIAHSFSNHNLTLLQKDYITVDSSPIGAWGNYDRIGRQNEYLYDSQTYGKKYSEEFMNVRRAEIRFIRAFYYFKMIRIYGGVILRDEVGGVDTEAQKDKARSTEAQSWDFVIKDLQFAAQHLPDKWESKWTGRLTKGSAYAMLARCGVYAKRWDITIDAAAKLDEKGTYGLMDNYADVFKIANNKEILFAVSYKSPDLKHFFDRYFRPSGDNSTSKGWAGPTNELVDSYEMSDGTNFSWSNTAHAAKPYTGREPRFYASILYNGAPWRERTVETFVGGKDGYVQYASGTNPETTVTGYYIRKYLQESNNTFNTDGSDQYWIELRYAEVLLNLAEALAQENYGTNSAKALAALNKIRTRVDLPPKTIADAPDLSAFMKLLARERMVELAFEGHRFWDIRRWRIAGEVINGKQAHGTKITKKTDGTFTYEIVSCDGPDYRYFPEKYYLLPIPSSEWKNNVLCENNPLW